ncbi:MAG: radical SAM protein [Polyangiaceae bacterium]
MRLRFEPWGAWAKLDQEVDTPFGMRAAIVGLDRDEVRALGLDGAEAWTSDAPPTPPIEVHVAVTSQCGAGCEGCYLDAKPDGAHVPHDDLMKTFDALERSGVFTVAFGGGEPTLRDDIGELAIQAKRRGITPVVTTSGIGLTAAKVERLRELAQVNVSYDGVGDDYEKVRGFDGANAAERAIQMLKAAGIKVGVNVVLTQGTFENLSATIARAKELGACEAQLLRYKPAGRAASLDYLAKRLRPEQVNAFSKTLRELVAEHCDTDFSPTAGLASFSIRVDCALVPFFSADPELAGDPDRLTRFGIFGCEAGGALAAVRSDGLVAPCSFAGPTETRGDAIDDHDVDKTLSAWRAYAAAPLEPCASCTLRHVCRGGCKIVSSFVDHAHGPDPECPRVRAHRS